MSPFPCRVTLPPPLPPLEPSPLRSAPRGRPRQLALASAPARPPTPRQARFLVCWLLGEGFFGGALTPSIASLGGLPLELDQGTQHRPHLLGICSAAGDWRGGVGECRRGFSRAPLCSGRAEGGGNRGAQRRAWCWARGLRSAPRGRRRPLVLSSAPARPPTSRQARFLVFRLFGEGFSGTALTRFIPSLRAWAGLCDSAGARIQQRSHLCAASATGTGAAGGRQDARGRDPLGSVPARLDERFRRVGGVRTRAAARWEHRYPPGPRLRRGASGSAARAGGSSGLRETVRQFHPASTGFGTGRDDPITPAGERPGRTVRPGSSFIASLRGVRPCGATPAVPPPRAGEPSRPHRPASGRGSPGSWSSRSRPPRRWSSHRRDRSRCP